MCRRALKKCIERQIIDTMGTLQRFQDFKLKVTLDSVKSSCKLSLLLSSRYFLISVHAHKSHMQLSA